MDDATIMTLLFYNNRLTWTLNFALLMTCFLVAFVMQQPVATTRWLYHLWPFLV